MAQSPLAPAREAGAASEGEAVRDYVLDEQVGFLLRRAHQRATAVFLEVMGDEQLTPTQFAAMVKLLDHGGLSQNHLGRLTAMDPATIQGVVRRLCARRLIESCPDARDRRRTILELTPRGRALIESLIAHGHRVSDAVLAPLSARERAQFLGLLKRLG